MVRSFIIKCFSILKKKTMVEIYIYEGLVRVVSKALVS